MSVHFGDCCNARVKSGFAAAVAAFALAALALWSSPASAQSKGAFANYQPIGCYYNPSDKKLWVGTIGLTPKALANDFYDDPSFTVVLKVGDQKYEIAGQDVIVHLMKDFRGKGSDKYKFLKYSLVVDYSASIDVNTRTDVLNTLDRFIDRLPLAVEGQLIRFSDKIEKFPFTSDKNEIKLQLKQPITYGMTSLHDSLMEAATSLIQQGSNIPIKIIVIFTDGNDTSSQTYKDRTSFIASFSSLVKQERIAVLAVGVTKDQDSGLLKAISDSSQGISGAYLNVPNFGPEFDKAFDQVRQLVDNTVVFRLPKLGPDKGKAEISIASKSQSGSLTTLQIFDCEY